MSNEYENESCSLGQFVPVHYHHNALMDRNRMRSFKAAINYAVFPGAKVLELGGGTGALSCFAAAKADKVWCVEFNPDMVDEARRMLAFNADGAKVDVVQADAFTYLPPEPVDVVICEMLHVGMLREKQLDVINSFKQRYLAQFGGPLPVFLPEAVVMAVQPLAVDYGFDGYFAPIVQFQDAATVSSAYRELAEPQVYSLIDFQQGIEVDLQWAGQFTAADSGTLNALRFINKNILAVLETQATTIDWLPHYMTLPLATPVAVEAGDIIDVRFAYRAGNSIASLQNALEVTVRSGELALPSYKTAVYA